MHGQMSLSVPAGNTPAVAYDEDLAERVREALAREPGLSEKRMFGGMGFLLDGHLVVSASGQGGLLLRVDPADSDALIADPNAARAVMRGREMAGWLRIRTDTRATVNFKTWIERGVAFVRSLPLKLA